MRKYFISFIIFSLIFFLLAFFNVANFIKAQTSGELLSENSSAQANIQTETEKSSPFKDKLASAGNKIIEVIKGVFKKFFGIWKNVHQKITKWWKEKTLPKIQEWLREKFLIIREEFDKEKEELKEQIKQVISKSWQWLKDLIR